MTLSKTMVLIIIAFCLVMISLFSAGFSIGYHTGYEQGKAEWFPIGELAGRTNQLADQLRSEYQHTSYYPEMNYNRSERNFSYTSSDYADFETSNWTPVFFHMNNTVTEQVVI